MKKAILIFILTLVCSTIYAQDFSDLKNETRLNVEFDYSEVLINGLNIEDFADAEEDWKKDEPKIYGKFISNFNKKMKNLVGGRVKNANYTLTIHPLVISDKGNIKAYFVITNSEGREVYKSEEVKGSGGTFGSQLNLMGDGMQSLGKKIGSLVNKLIK